MATEKLKTIKQLLRALPLKARRRAFKNVRLQGQCNLDDVKVYAQTPSYALNGAFTWAKTPEGGKYWVEQSDLLLKQEIGG